MRRFLTPRWMLGHVAVLTVAVVCVSLGMWQLRRLDDRRDLIARIDSRMTAPVTTLERLLPLGPSAAYRRVQVTGSYDADTEAVVRGRGLPGRPGNRLLTALVTPHGTLVVDRGWIPLGLDRPPVRDAPPTSDDVSVTGVLLPSEGRGEPSDADALARPDLGRLAGRMPGPILAHYLLLEDQDPRPGELPVPAPLPRLDQGPHLAYAVQWFIFAGVAGVVWAAVLRRTRRRAT